MNTAIIQADDAALRAYSRAHDDGAPHALALNIAVSVWFCRCPHIDGGWARRRVSRLIETIASRRSA